MNKICRFCNGQGIFVADDYEVCPYCVGTGYRLETVRSKFFEFVGYYELVFALRLWVDSAIDRVKRRFEKK